MSNHLAGREIFIIGGGIAGLTVALALARRGAVVELSERAGAFREVGAGLQISPNAGFVLDALGVLQDLKQASAHSQGVILNDNHGRQVAKLPLASRFPGSSFRFIHRARLVELLEQAARQAGVRITLGQEVTSFPETGLIIGADGLHSRVRAYLNGPAKPFFTGQTAWRAVIDDDTDDIFARVFMGPGRHLVSYPLANGLRNIVAVIERPDWTSEGWSHEDDPQNLRDAFAGFAGPVPGWLERVTQTGIWGLFRHEVAPRWHDDRHVILGDAAHATLPFMAQGAVMAIEDAWVLAASLDADEDQQAALSRYQTLREARVRRVVDMANKNARNYHLHGPARLIAHTGLRGLSRIAPSALMARFDWLYGFNPVKGNTA
ncbi:FAD-dependent monooxygenase [Paracoccus aerodenitrificans]|uniref:FAD-dependent monooxygenase n=1 Tax=Paracoccus aerodenitrificans TaxID=3017781 RepID=UPI0022F0ABBA|nr:FAD-dependent monooxygenase [Paracoccus aerodenitrificans]WBU65024.1 FAD-dependent monooxygenase [Paracoccus aerodenitrificans]